MMSVKIISSLLNRNIFSLVFSNFIFSLIAPTLAFFVVEVESIQEKNSSLISQELSECVIRQSYLSASELN